METGGGEDCACLKYVKEASGSAAAAASAPQFVWWVGDQNRGRVARHGWLVARGGRAGRGGRQGCHHSRRVQGNIQYSTHLRQTFTQTVILNGKTNIYHTNY
eukprot:COSAG05_NODE_454_length_9643_cov_5.989627_7_plen_102_part_00